MSIHNLKKKIVKRKLYKQELSNKKKLKKIIINLQLDEEKIKDIKNDEEIRKTVEWKLQNSKERAIKAKAYTATICAIALLTISVSISIIIDSRNLPEWQHSIGSSILNAVNTVTSIIAGIGIGTLVLDFFSYISYTRERLKEIVVDKTFMKSLSDEEKKRIIFMTEESLYFKDGSLPQNSLYADVKKKVTPLLDYFYFERFTMRVDCIIDEKKRVICKSIHKTMTINSNKDDNKFILPYCIDMIESSIEKKDMHSIESCYFNGKNITEDFSVTHVDIDEKHNNNLERTRFSSNYTFSLKKGLNEIKLYTNTIVPINDVSYIHKVSLPCKQYDVTFNINTDRYQVSGYGFAIENVLQDSYNRTVDTERFGDSMKISINQWTLPGEGTIFIIDKK